MNFFQIETYTLQIIQCLYYEDGDSSFYLILLDIKDLMSHFYHVFISFAKHCVNRIFHLLVWVLVYMTGHKVLVSYPSS